MLNIAFFLRTQRGRKSAREGETRTLLSLGPAGPADDSDISTRGLRRTRSSRHKSTDSQIVDLLAQEAWLFCCARSVGPCAGQCMYSVRAVLIVFFVDDLPLFPLVKGYCLRILPMCNSCLCVKCIVFQGETGSKQVSARPYWQPEPRLRHRPLPDRHGRRPNLNHSGLDSDRYESGRDWCRLTARRSGGGNRYTGPAPRPRRTGAPATRSGWACR